MSVGHESAIISGAFWKTASENCILPQFSGIESHNSIGAGYPYHFPLWQVFPFLRSHHPSLHPESCLRLRFKGMNDTMGPHGLVSTLLVSSALASLPVTSTHYPLQEERMRALQCTHEEMGPIVASFRTGQALCANPLPAALIPINPCDSIRMYKEGARKEEGPFIES